MSEVAELSLRGLTVRFGATVAVDDVDLDLPRGEVLAVVGPSGCGKSTLLRAVAGLEVPSEGQVLLGGADQRDVPTHRRGVALLFQDGQLFPHLDAGGNVEYPMRLRRVAARERTARADELLELVGLGGLARRRPSELSGGEQQRVALARALAARPRLLLLDEPLSALDRALRERLAADLRRIVVETGTTAMLVTHDHDEAFTVADQVAVMFAGRLVQRGPATQVWRRPLDEQVARFLGYRTVLDGAAAERFLTLPGAPTAAGVGWRPGRVLVLRPSAVRAVPGLGTEAGATVRSVGRGSDALHLQLDVEGVGEVAALASPLSELEPGAAVGLQVDPAGVAVLPGQLEVDGMGA